MLLLTTTIENVSKYFEKLLFVECRLIALIATYLTIMLHILHYYLTTYTKRTKQGVLGSLLKIQNYISLLPIIATILVRTLYVNIIMKKKINVTIFH